MKLGNRKLLQGPELNTMGRPSALNRPESSYN